jgi:hypothetical protein
MMNESVIVTKLSIRLQGERKHFQINLPNDAKYIVGVEYGLRLIDAIPEPPIDPTNQNPIPDDSLLAIKTLFKSNQLIGELRLQSCEKANWFFTADVFTNTNNLNLVDVSDLGFQIKEYTHNISKNEEVVGIDSGSMIQGWFLDALGKQFNQNLRYEISVYVWIKTEEEL